MDFRLTSTANSAATTSAMKNGATPSDSISSQRFATRGRAISRCRSASPSTSRCVQRGSMASIRFGRSTASWCPTVELMRSWKAAGSAAPRAEGVRPSFCAAPEGHDPRVWQGRWPSNVSPCTGVRRFSLSFCAGCSASPTTSPRPRSHIRSAARMLDDCLADGPRYLVGDRFMLTWPLRWRSLRSSWPTPTAERCRRSPRYCLSRKH